MRVKSHLSFGITVAALMLATTLSAVAESVEGLWDATVTVNGTPIPFRLEISGQGTNVRSCFFNGDESASGVIGFEAR